MSKLSDFLEFSPFDNKVSSDFLKEIPNIVIEPNGRIDKEKAFWDKFFVEYSIDQYDNTIRAIGEVLIDSNKHYILFIGTSGSGKTTFLNYLVKYKDEYFKNDIQIDLINLIKDPSCAGIGPEIIHDSLDEKIVQYLNREVVAEIARYYVLYQGREESWNIKWLLGKDPVKYDKHDVFYNFIRYNRSNYSINEVREFCRAIDNISDKMALYIISFIMNKCIDGQKPCSLFLTILMN